MNTWLSNFIRLILFYFFIVEIHLCTGELFKLRFKTASQPHCVNLQPQFPSSNLQFLSVPPQAFGQAYSNQRKVAEDGESNEETLLRESASKEAYFMGRLLELQSELTLSRSVASNAQAETERLSTLVQELREVNSTFTPSTTSLK